MEGCGPILFASSSNSKVNKRPIGYNFVHFSHEIKNLMNWCNCRIKHIICPTCLYEFTDDHENRTFGTHSLMCPKCQTILERGEPSIHGDWKNDAPLLTFSGTDYGFYRHRCKLGMGLMDIEDVVIAFEDNGRKKLMLNLCCLDCGYRDVIKHLTKEKARLVDYNSKKYIAI